MDSEGLWQFVYDLIDDAAEIGYTVAQIETPSFALPWEGAKLRTASVARAVAALLQVDVVEDDQPFDPDWLTKRNAAHEARKAALIGEATRIPA